MLNNNCNINLIFEAIKADNLAVFSQHINDNFDISIGRFPLLSVCYLYNAKKIIKKYQNQFFNISEYVKYPEIHEIYKKFLVIAGRSLRLYSLPNCTVSALEMLALLNKDNKVRRLYKKFYKNQQIIDNLKYIYQTVNNQNIKINSATLKLAPRSLKYYERTYYKKSMLISATFCFVFIACFVVCALSVGATTPFSSAKVFSETQLLSAFKSNGNYVLQNDISITKNIKAFNFSGNFDGNGKTIYINDVNNWLIENNKGVIKNINIVYAPINKTISSSLSLFVKENNNVIQNVTVTCEQMNLTCQKNSKNIEISAIALTNNATIKNCKVKLNAQVTAQGSGECFISGFAVNNNSTVKNCVFETGEIQTSEVDASGFVINNSVNSNIINCVNNCNISQISEINDWSPNVSGIVQTNYGTIKDCHNFANLCVTSSNMNQNTQAVAFVGGIACVNYANVIHCLNKGNLTVSTNATAIYCGGITAYSYFWVQDNIMNLPKIDSCGSSGIINCTTQTEKALAFVGGITGILYGDIHNCYSSNTYVNGYNQNKYFFGLAIGASFLEYDFFNTIICINASNNYVLEQQNVYFQIGAILFDGATAYIGQNSPNNEVITLSTLSQLQQTEVYWNE